MERLGEIEEGLERLYVDSFRTSEFFMRMFEGMGVDVREKRCVARHEQTLKDGRELEGFRLCHKGDGVVMVKLLYEVLRGEGMKESDVERRIESLRGEREDYVEKSFSSIVGSGSNGAIVHYRVGEDTDRELRGGDVVLIDCGGHYRNGTTDVTRTIGLGEVGREEKRLYTRVLRSHVMLSRQSFPKGTTGTQLDAIARSELWNEGLDYGHGTGHGVGYVLGVHESPPVLTKKGGTILEAGMVLSIEPGLYFEGLYGFRVENLVEVEERGEGLGFRALTCVPYARDMIEVEMLSEADRLWVDGYHAWVWTCLEDEGLEEEERLWLWEMTRPLEVVG
jgi:Xaa-Pro aminopeptidase